MHVIVKFLCLAQLAVLLSFIQTSQLIYLAGLFSMAAFSFSQAPFIHMLKRIKWLLIVLGIIYAFSTPGEYIHHWITPLRPTYEGVASGLTQMLNIIAMLAGLALLISTTTRSKLIGGIYQLLLPLKALRFNPEKFAIRTWLTMHYVETDPSSMQFKSFDLEKMLENQLSSYQPCASISIEVDAFKLHDYLAAVLLLLSFFIWARLQ